MRQLGRKRRTPAVSLGILKIPRRIRVTYGSGNVIGCRLSGKDSNAALRGPLSQRNRAPESHFRETGHDGRVDSFFMFFSSHFFVLLHIFLHFFTFFLYLSFVLFISRSISQTRFNNLLYKFIYSKFISTAFLSNKTPKLYKKDEGSLCKTDIDIMRTYEYFLFFNTKYHFMFLRKDSYLSHDWTYSINRYRYRTLKRT